MKNNTSFRFGFSGFGIVLAVSFVLNGLLGVSGFEKTYRESLVSQFSIQGETLKGKIESSLNLGKKLYLLDNQIDGFFYESMRLSEGISHFYVADSSGTILYSTRTVLNQRKIPFDFSAGYDIAPGAARPEADTVKFLDSWYICVPLYSEESFFEGTLLIEFSRLTVSSFILKTAERIVRSGLAVFFSTLALYVLLFFLLRGYRRSEAFITVLLLLGSQLVFTFQNFSLYNTAISEIFGKNMSVQAKSITEDVQKVLDYNVALESLGSADKYLEKRIRGNPQCASAYITDINLNVIFTAGQSASAQTKVRTLTRQDSDLTILPLSSAFGNGYLVLRVNRDLINSILRDMALDSGTVILVALIFAFILKDLLELASSPGKLRQKPAELAVSDPEHSLSMIRISTFMFMFAAFETLSFIPLYIQEVFRASPFSISGIDERTLISLPVGSYMLGIMIAMFITLFVLKAYSIRTRYIMMTLFFILGSWLTIEADTFIVLTAARLVAGFGFGGVLLSTSSLVITYTTDKTRSSGFGTNAAAFAAASICSIPIGGIIVNKFGYETGIWISVVFAFFFLVFALTCLAPNPKRTARAGAERGDHILTVGAFFRILFSRHILVYIICVNIPFQLIYVGLFQFLLPLYMSDTLALSQGNIGRILTIFSIVSLGAAWVSRLSDRVKKDNLLIAFGAMCAGVLLILFKMYPEGGLMLFMGVMIAMGVDNVFIDAIEEVYVASGRVRGVTEENLLQSYKTIEKILSVFVPTVTGIAIMKLGFGQSMLVIGVWSAVGAAAFVLLGRNGRWEKK